MGDTSIKCPVCNSDETKISTVTDIVENHWFGTPFRYQAVTNICSWCGADGDFNGVNDIKITEAIQHIQSSSGHEYIDTIIDQHNLSPASLDLLLGLGIGSTNKLRHRDMSQLEYLFFRLLKKNPQILNTIKQWNVR